MKKTLLFVLTLTLLSLFCSCQTIKHNSVEEYAAQVSSQGYGYSDVEIDNAKDFLPSKTFITDYKYENGKHHYYEECMNEHNVPTRSFLLLKYTPEVYEEAKAFALNNIPQYGNDTYSYNDYTFYKNENFVISHEKDFFPRWFTMACYNDSKNELVFIGFYTTKLPDELDISQETWKEFIDKYYGEYHDFSK